MAIQNDHRLNAHMPSVVPQNRWFRQLSVPLQQRLLRAAKPVDLQEQQLVFRKSGAVRARRDGFALLVSGLLKVSSSTPDGREAILTYVQPGQWFGELAVLDRGQRPRDVICVEPARLLIVEPAEFAQLMQDEEFARGVMQLLTGRTRMLLELVEDFSLRSTRARAARRLIMLASDDDPYKSPMRKDLSVSHDALASMIGLTRPALGKQLQTLAHMGAIEQGYGKIAITSMVTLMAEAAAG
jgi:CRP/FNR family transcriptional regulator, cyclic AMP receptor protein